MSTTVATPVNLTSEGTLDWAYWAPTSGTGVTPPVAPTNDKTGGSIISSLSNVGGSTLRGSTTASTVERYSWSDGTSPVTGSNASLAGLIFNSSLGNSAVGTGLSFTLQGDPTTTRVAKLYLGGFAASGTLTLTLNGATTVVDTSQTYVSSSPKEISIFTVSYRPNLVTDLLSVQYTASAVTDTTNGHVGAQAVTVGTVPEPSAIGLGMIAVGGMFCRRRRVAR